MYLVTFVESDLSRVGVLDVLRDEVIDLAEATPDLPRNMLDFIARGDAALAEAKSAFNYKQHRLPISQVQLLAPIPRPVRNIICIGKNYRDHVQELESSGSACSDSTEELPATPGLLSSKLTR